VVSARSPGHEDSHPLGVTLDVCGGGG
jgi:hypothetical protein